MNSSVVPTRQCRFEIHVKDVFGRDVLDYEIDVDRVAIIKSNPAIDPTAINPE